LDTRVADLDELLIRELRLERLHETCGGLARGVRDDVKLDGRGRRHALSLPRYRLDLRVRQADEVAWVELDLETASTGADVDGLVAERGCVEQCRELAPSAERADSAEDIAGRALRFRRVREG